MDKFLADVEGVYKKLGRCVIAVSEGMCDTDHKTWAEKLAENEERDAHGNIQLSGTGALADFLAGQIKTNLKIKRVRADTFGYLQRSYAGLQSQVDVDEARACGRQAVKYAMEFDSGSVAMKRTGEGADYGVELVRTELCNVARKDQVGSGRIPQRRRQRGHRRVHQLRDAAGRWAAQDRVSGDLPAYLRATNRLLRAPLRHDPLSVRGLSSAPHGLCEMRQRGFSRAKGIKNFLYSVVYSVDRPPVSRYKREVL